MGSGGGQWGAIPGPDIQQAILCHRLEDLVRSVYSPPRTVGRKDVWESLAKTRRGE
jgi:hypothetical protein